MSPLDCGRVALFQFLVVTPGRTSRVALDVLELARQKGLVPDLRTSPWFRTAMALDMCRNS